MITQKMRYLREKNKLRHEDMAEQLGISTSAYSRLENGETKLDVERLKKIAEILAVSPEELLNPEPVVFNVSNNSGGTQQCGHVHDNLSEEFVKGLMDRYDAKHAAHVKELQDMNQRLLELLEKKLG